MVFESESGTLLGRSAELFNQKSDSTGRDFLDIDRQFVNRESEGRWDLFVRLSDDERMVGCRSQRIAEHLSLSLALDNEPLRAKGWGPLQQALRELPTGVRHGVILSDFQGSTFGFKMGSKLSQHFAHRRKNLREVKWQKTENPFCLVGLEEIHGGAHEEFLVIDRAEAGLIV
jgi:hypothetical protein